MQTLEDAIKRGLDSVNIRSQLYLTAFFRHDEAEMAQAGRGGAHAAGRLSCPAG